MFLLLSLACAEWFASESDTSESSTVFSRDDHTTGESSSTTGDDDDDSTAGVSLSFVTYEADVSDGEDVEMERPKGARLFRIESCYDGSDARCQDFDGHYYDYADGSFVISPSARDFETVEVTWMKVE